MPNTSKSSKKAPAAAGAAKAEFNDIFTDLYLKSFGRVAGLQKSSLDLAAEQSTEWIGAWKKAFSCFPVPSPTFFFDIAAQAVQTCVETQKKAIELAVEQNHTVTEVAKQRAGAYAKIAQEARGAFNTAFAQSVEAQKKVLQFAGAQNKAICEATKKQIDGGPAAVVVESFERGANTLFEAQKSFLEATTQPFAATA